MVLLQFDEGNVRAHTVVARGAAVAHVALLAGFGNPDKSRMSGVHCGWKDVG